jgi:hypothetical protein
MAVRARESAGWLRRLAPTPWGAAAIAAFIAAGFYLFGPPAGDAAAHLYQTQAWRAHGWQFWDNFWYAGRYSQVNYSLLFYPLAALLGVGTVVVASTAAAAGAFAVVVRRQWPTLAAGPTIAFAVLAPLGAAAGTYPFMLGLALALSAVAAFQAGHLGRSLVLALLTCLAHPLAFLFLLALLAGLAATSRGWWRRRDRALYALGVGTVAGLQLLLLRAFSEVGAQYPFDLQDLTTVAVFCFAGALLTLGLPDQRPMRALFGAYAVLAAASFLVPSPVGGNVVRLVALMGTPLVVVPLAARAFRPRALAALCLMAALFSQVMPAVGGWRDQAGARAASESFWYPAIAFLDRHHDPDFRVEVVATSGHWEAYYLAGRGVPLARGWYRQDDFPENAALYGAVTPSRYGAWLRRMGVRYVLLPDDPLDYSAIAEARVVRSGRELRLVARYAGWRIYELPGATPIATPARQVEVRSLTSDGIVLHVDRPGRYRLRLAYTPYWQVSGKRACVAPRQPWGTELIARRAGVVRIRFSVRLGSLVTAVLGEEGGCGGSSRPVGARGRAA